MSGNVKERDQNKCHAYTRTHEDTVRLSDKMQASESIYISSGRRGVQLRLSPCDLARATGAEFADITTKNNACNGD